MRRLLVVFVFIMTGIAIVQSRTALAPFGQFSEQPWEAKYSTSANSGWARLDYNDSSWKDINGPISTADGLDYSNFEPQNTYSHYVRRHFSVSSLSDEEYIFYVTHSSNCEAYINGHLIYSNNSKISTTEYKKAFVPSSWLTTGDNILSVYIRNSSNPIYLDFGLYGEDINWLTVDLSSPGSLGREVLYQVDVLGDVEALRVKGTMNSEDFTAISNMANIRALDLSQAKAEAIPNNLLDGHSEFHDVLLPQNLKTIGDNAFRNTKLCNITIPASVSSIGSSVFSGDTYLSEVIFSQNSQLTSIGSYAFQSCTALKSIQLPNGITSLDSQTFRGCTSLSSVVLPATLKSIGEYCFYQTSALKSIDLPQTVTSIYRYAFQQSGLESVVLPLNLDYLGSYAFANCGNIKRAELPATPVLSTEYSRNGYYHTFYSCTALEEVVCHSATPPVIDSAPFASVDVSKVTLVVPAFAIVDYKLSTYWHDFGTIVEGAEPSLLNIRSELTLTNNRRPANKVDVLLGQDGRLTVGGNSPFEVGTMTFTVNTPDKSYGQFVNLDAGINADMVTTSYRVYRNRWYFLTPLHDIDISNISHSDAEAAFVFRYYNGQNRADNGPKDSWQMLTESTIHAGQGYILQTNRDGWLTMPATASGKAAALVSSDVEVALNTYKSANSTDANWNYVGNPYPCYYDTYYMNTAAPITVRDYSNNTYRAYSPIDDNYVLSPMEAFFIQKPEGLSKILFQQEGRQFADKVQRTAESRVNVGAGPVPARQLFDIEITDGTHSDYTRIVLSRQASLEYEPAADASKFFSQESMVPQLYTLDADGQALAINERPVADGTVRLGLTANTPGSYTIKLSRGTDKLELHDALTGQTTDLSLTAYTFSIDEAGTIDDRFVLVLSSPSSISSVETKAAGSTRLYDMQGRRILGQPSKGIYLRDGKKYMAE